jgi:hypothetical protein
LKKLFSFAVTLFSFASIISCDGIRIRSADFDISRAEVDTQIKTLQTSSVGTSSLPAASQASYTAFFDLANTEGSIIYYSEAPSSMGSVQTVLPITYNSFGVSQPAAARAYLVYVPSSDGPKAALLVTELTKDANGADIENPLIALASSGTGTVDGTDLTVPVTYGDQALQLASYDAEDGSFGDADVVQFEILQQVDSDNEDLLGKMNFVRAD